MIDLEAITKETGDIIKYSQAFPFDINPKALIGQWYNAKRKIINKLNGETRIKTHVKINLSTEQRDKHFSDFISVVSDTGVITSEFNEFLQDNKHQFFENKVTTPYPSRNITQGMKLSKSFKNFVPEEKLHEIQNIASKFMQKDHIEGDLYISIDPRDFLTASQNGERWESCYTVDGMYRVSSLSYLIDDVTIMAYLTTQDKKHYHGLPIGYQWSSKRWRMFFHIGKECVYYNRHYPFPSQELLNETYKIIKDWYNKPLKKDKLNPPIERGFNTCLDSLDKELMLGCQQLTVDHMHCYPVADVINTKDLIGYNDFIDSFYNVRLSLTDKAIKQVIIEHIPDNTQYYNTLIETIGIKIGEKPLCPCCGEHYLDRTDSFLCEDCRDKHNIHNDIFTQCEYCGCRLYEEEPDEIMFVNKYGDLLCKECYTEWEDDDDGDS